jgi:hypothetical protein
MVGILRKGGCAHACGRSEISQGQGEANNNKRSFEIASRNSLTPGCGVVDAGFRAEKETRADN